MPDMGLTYERLNKHQITAVIINNINLFKNEITSVCISHTRIDVFIPIILIFEVYSL